MITVPKHSDSTPPLKPVAVRAHSLPHNAGRSKIQPHPVRAELPQLEP